MNSSYWIERWSTKKHEPSEYRSPYMRDECRVVHSFSFRRLQGKTQVLGPEQGDFHRNRLTHSIEVASIGRGIVKYIQTKEMPAECLSLLNPKKQESCSSNDYDYLISAICLLHDVGHPPFGHAGEEALNFKMLNHHGFEANAQTLRIVSFLEPYTERFGLDLTRRVLLGLVKYPVPYSMVRNNNFNPELTLRNRDMKRSSFEPPKCYYDDDNEVMRWLTKKFTNNDKERLILTELKNDKIQSIYKTFDCSIMDLADDIAYSVHDLEDAIFLELINQKDLEEELKLENLSTDKDNNKYDGNLCEDFTNNKDLYKRKEAFSHIIKMLIDKIEISENNEFDDPILKYKAKFSDDAQKIIEDIKKLIKNKTYESQEIQTIVFGGMMTIMQLFDVLVANPEKLLPPEYVNKISDSEDNNYRTVCDYISGMTDDFARRLHERIYGNSPGSVFEKL